MEGECVALQDTREGLLAQNSSAPPPVPYTAVNMGAEPPKDYIIWSILTFISCCNPCCLGMAALVFSIKARDRKVVGDMNGAQHYGATAKCFNTIATALVVTLVISSIIAIVVVVVQMQQVVLDTSRFNPTVSQ